MSDRKPSGPGAEGAERTLLQGGRYELIEPLGIGGVATVFRALDRTLNVQRAVKLLHPFVVTDDVAVSRFLDEARLMARIEHPNVLRVLDLGRHEDHYFCVMELMKNGSVAQYVTQHGALNPLRALTLTFQVLDALCAAHELGVVHRDVRPANVLLASDGSARLADFGIARLRRRVEDLTVTGEDLGMRGYAAPEQRRDARTVSTATDVYGAGATLLFMLRGSVGAGPLAAAVRPLPPPIQRVLSKALHPDVRVRTATAVDMARAVAQAYDQLAGKLGRSARAALWLEDLSARRLARGGRTP